MPPLLKQDVSFNLTFLFIKISESPHVKKLAPKTNFCSSSVLVILKLTKCKLISGKNNFNL